MESRDISRLVNSNEPLVDIFTKVSKRIEDRLYLHQPGHIRLYTIQLEGKCIVIEIRSLSYISSNPTLHERIKHKNWSLETLLDLSTIMNSWLTYSPKSLKRIEGRLYLHQPWHPQLILFNLRGSVITMEIRSLSYII